MVQSSNGTLNTKPWLLVKQEVFKAPSFLQSKIRELKESLIRSGDQQETDLKPQNMKIDSSDGQTKISTPWAPVEAKKMTKIDIVVI